MVLESNSQFHTINKHIINFLSSLDIEEELKSEVILAWKEKANINKLKNFIKKPNVDKPKRIISKYLYFCQEERVAILATHPEMNIRAVTCELGRRWQEFQASPDPVRMEKITKLFEEDKKRYDTAKHQIIQQKEPKKRTPPKSAYLMFCEEERSKEPKVTMKELGIRWAVVKQNSTEFQRFKIMVAVPV